MAHSCAGVVNTIRQPRDLIRVRLCAAMFFGDAELAMGFRVSTGL